MAKIFLGRQLTQLESIALESLYEKEHFKVSVADGFHWAF